MTTTESEIETEAVHGWFGLTYANYLVLHRTLLQSMPDEWQNRFVACLRELEDAFSHIEKAEGYKVEPAREREVGELSAEELKKIGYSCAADECGCFASKDAFGDVRQVPKVCPHETTYYDDRENEVEYDHRVMWPTGYDPVPHYNRGRTHVEPKPTASIR